MTPADEIRKLLNENRIFAVPRKDYHTAILSLLGVIEQMSEALAMFKNSAYPVAKEIDKRGHRWSETYLDEALVEATTIFTASADYVALAREHKP